MSKSSPSCLKCGVAVPSDAPEGLCPACVLEQVMNAGAEAIQGQRTASYHPGFVPPAPAELAGLFPQMEVLELVGQGGMGVVYKARQPGLDRLVALKILPPEAGRDPAFAERFIREARALARLSHPGIVAVYDFGQSAGLYYFIMEFVDGVDLRHLLQEGRLKPREALEIVPRICEALQYAHDEGIVHRDIKPENILLDKKGRVKIADFGLARLLGPTPTAVALTDSRQIMGTPYYMAPEQTEKPLAVDHRADIYSLGVVFYEMLTGELPLGRFPLPSQKVQVDGRLDEVVLRALEKEPERRYQHASEVKTDVESISPIDDQPVRLPRTAGRSRAGQSAARTWHRWVILGVVGWVYVICLVLPAYRVSGHFTSGSGNLTGQPVGPFTLNGWSCFEWGWTVAHPSWWANSVLWIGCGLLASRRWLGAGFVGQAALLLGLLVLVQVEGTPLVGYWAWLTSMALLAGGGLYGWWMFGRNETPRQVTSDPPSAPAVPGAVTSSPGPARRFVIRVVTLALGVGVLSLALQMIAHLSGNWLPDPFLLGLSIGLCLLSLLGLHLARRKREPIPGGVRTQNLHPGLQGLRWLLACFNVAVLLVCVALTKPRGSWGFSYRTGNEVVRRRQHRGHSEGAAAGPQRRPAGAEGEPVILPDFQGHPGRNAGPTRLRPGQPAVAHPLVAETAGGSLAAGYGVC